MDSNAQGKWSVEEAMTAVKAEFLVAVVKAASGGVQVSPNKRGAPGYPPLRYVDIRQGIRERRHISDRTLAKALHRLQKEGFLTREPRAEGYRYFFNEEVPVEQQRSALASVAERWIRDAAPLGVAIDDRMGPVVFGFPLEIAKRIGPRLDRRTEEFRRSVEDILDSEADRTIRLILKKGKGKVQPVLSKSADRALVGLWRDVGELKDQLGVLSWVAAILEVRLPGALEVAGRRLAPKVLPVDLVGTFRMVGTQSGMTAGDVEAFIQKSGKLAEAIAAFLALLRPEDASWVRQEFARLLQMRASICILIR